MSYEVYNTNILYSTSFSFQIYSIQYDHIVCVCSYKQKVVKRAGRRGSSDEYVVKCFNIYDANKRRMLREEMRLLMAMSSPSIVSFLGAFLDSSQRICIILEFMNKGSLEDVVVFSRRYHDYYYLFF
jgi:serine/threonine protein kinase